MPFSLSLRVLFLGLTLLLTACATRGALVKGEGDALARQIQREQALRTQLSWGFSGRMGLSRDGEGGQASLSWQQRPEGLRVEIDAPLGAGRWRLSQANGSYRLQGSDGLLREGADAAGLLHEATGMHLPIDALPSWVRGARRTADATVSFDARGRLSEIHEAGWRIVYERWDAQDRPLRLTATREHEGQSLRLRLLIERWEE